MKRLSIKTRITLWYTGFMILLVAFSLVIIFIVSGRISSRQTEDTLRNVVTDVVSDISFRYGEPDTEDIDFYRDGVSVFIYDTSGRLLAPRVNMGVQVDSVLQDQRMRKVENAGGDSMVYDIYAVKDDNAFWVRGISSMAEAESAYRTLNLLILLTFPIFIIISAAGGRRITERAFAPVRDMAATAQRISSGDQLTERIDTGGFDDELSSLAETLNSMFERLSRSFEKERQFTSDVAHELRTPLAVIKAECEYALSSCSEPAEKEQALLAVYRQSERMNKMTEQLLMLSRADRGTLKFETGPVDMSMPVSHVCDDLMPVAEAAGLSLKAEVEKEIRVMGDETLLIRLLTNLITNAIKYNREGGSVTVTLKKEAYGCSHASDLSGVDNIDKDTGSACILTVSDTGTGISEEDLPKIWDRFYRAEKSRSSEGSGLGLSMVKKIAELHGAEISVKSKPGEGSSFSLRFKCI